MTRSFRDFYEGLLGRPLPPGGPEVSIQCFHHEDEHNSCSLNLDRGVWFCHAHSVGGDAVKAYSIVKDVSIKDAKKAVAKLGIPTQKKEKPAEGPVIQQPIVDEYRRALSINPKALKDAAARFGWSDSTLKKFEIGFHQQLGRYTIPVRDDSDAVRNIRMYDPDAQGLNKMTSWRTGAGDARLFPLWAFERQTIYIVEGEKDCILMNQVLEQHGQSDSAAVTGTGGAGTWRDSWNERFRGKDVVVVYDLDGSGEENAKRVAGMLLGVASSLKNVRLDITEPKNADVTDYFVHSSKGWDDFERLIESTDPFTPQNRSRNVVAPDTTVYTPHLSQASDDEFINKKLKLKVIVAGKELAPYVAPRKVVWECQMNAGSLCKSCAMNYQGGLIEYEFAKHDPQYINMVKVSDIERDAFMRKLRGVNRRCNLVEQHVESWRNVEEVTFIPEIDFSDHHREYVTRTGYVMAHGVRANQGYVVDGTIVNHPKTQQAVHHIHSIQPAQDSIEDFEMDDEKMEMLRVFQPSQGQTVADKMDEIAADLTANITRIYGREDLVKAIDLCYHTVLGFEFQGSPVAKAWGDILIIGDTRTGKTETLAAMIRHYRLGELALGENMSYAGIVGGLRQEAGKRWSVAWGKIPLNDRRLLAIDETSGLPLEVISGLSGIRSNGVAEIAKIVTERTMARTRLVFLSNPRADMFMGDYNYGIEAVRSLIGRPEDIARFDFVVSSAVDEVPIETINAGKQSVIPHTYTTEHCRNLILWAWSRESDQIVVTDEATEACLDLAVYQSRRYSTKRIPLVHGGNHRIKLAKLAVAAACRQFSTDDGVRVIVKAEHVQYAAQFLEQVYSKSSLDYLRQSEQINKKEYIDQSVADEVRDWIKTNPEWADYWIENDLVRVEDVKTAFDMETNEARSQLFKPLTRWRMIERSKSSAAYTKTAAFIRFLKSGKKHQQKAQDLEPEPAPTVAEDPAPSMSEDEEMPF
jgi:hypothetical protein